MEVIKKKNRTGHKRHGPWPQGRSGHRLAGSGNNLYVYGGYSNNDHRLFKEFWEYNFLSGRWTLKSQPGFPEHVASASAALIGQYLLVFGGTAFPFGGNNSNALYALDIATGHMTKQQTTGENPDGTYGHGCAVDEVDKKLYIVGGTSGTTFSSEVYCLDLTTKVWKILKSMNNPPESRYRHEMALYNNKLFVFGGGTISTAFSLAAIPYFDLATRHWELAITTEADLGRRRYGFPESRKCHSGVMVPATCNSDAKYIICGGIQGQEQLDDIWSLNLRTMQWSKFKLKLPNKIHFHDATLISSGKMVVFGGVKRTSAGQEVRISDLAVCTVFLAQLQELAWEAMVTHFPQLTRVSSNALRSIGVPQEFVKRLI